MWSRDQDQVPFEDFTTSFVQGDGVHYDCSFGLLGFGSVSCFKGKTGCLTSGESPEVLQNQVDFFDNRCSRLKQRESLIVKLSFKLSQDCRLSLDRKRAASRVRFVGITYQFHVISWMR